MDFEEIAVDSRGAPVDHHDPCDDSHAPRREPRSQGGLAAQCARRRGRPWGGGRVSEALLSSSWYRVAHLKPRLRRHARLHRHHYRGQRWYVLRDAASQRWPR